jgi:hypothetical protein
MRDSDTFPEQTRRHVVHIYAALREHICDELKYDRSPDFEPLDGEAFEAVGDTIYGELTELMYAAHEEEAATIEARRDASYQRMEEERQAAFWRLDVGVANADWLDGFAQPGVTESEKERIE